MKKEKEKRSYIVPACTIIPLQMEYYVLTQSPSARPGGGGESGNKGSISVSEFDDGGSEEIEDD